jgi:uncharacterized membrane protein
MLNGLLILAITLLVLLAINYFTIRFFKLSELKRERLRKISVRIYVVFLVFLGVLNLVEENNFFGWGHFLVGIVFLFADRYDRKRKNL